jgi:hypothetical protein
MRKMFGVGTPKALQGRLRAAFSLIAGLKRTLRLHWGQKTSECADIYDSSWFMRRQRVFRLPPENAHLHHLGGRVQVLVLFLQPMLTKQVGCTS